MNILDEVSVLEHTDLVIGGKARPTAERIDVLDPATGEPIAAIASATPDDVDDAIAAARGAQKAWSRLLPRERAQVLNGIARLIREHGADLARIESLDTGKALKQAKSDVEVAAQYFEFYAGLADKFYGTTMPMGGDSFSMTFREPMGVAAIIVPWNYPMQIGSRGIAPALMTGNAVVLKPASEAPLSPIALAGLALEAGLPAGVLNVVTGPGSKVGNYLSSHDGVDCIAFTGSVETGSVVQTNAAKNVKPVLLELGGKSPSLVLPDADLDRALPVLTNACIQNSGQTCSAGTRLVVHRDVVDEVVDRFRASLDAVNLGHGVDDPDMGPVISDRQRSIILDYINVAKEQGASVAAGGTTAEVDGYPGGFWVRPTLLAGVKHEDRVSQEEIFGPVLSVISGDDDKTLIEYANGTEFGLVSSVWTRDIDRAMRIARQIDHGQVYINSYGAAGGVPLAFGGFKKSGFGREKGVEGANFYCQTKTVIVSVPEA
jgi:acyl-CoA reductase-like NAD-dependent aldehyde dehydrogenase